MGKTWDRVKKIWDFVDYRGSRALKHPLGVYLLTGAAGVGITFFVFVYRSEQEAVMAGFLFTIWALLLAAMIYRFSAPDGKHQADMKELLTETHALAGQSQAKAKDLLEKVEGLTRQLDELTRSQQLHGQYETSRGIPGSRMVTKSRTGDNYVISLYGRPRLLLTKLSPYSAADSPQDNSLS